MDYDIICMSDLHLGAANCEAKHIRRFLHKLIKAKKLSTKKLIILGDGFDDIKNKPLKPKHLKVIKLIKKLSKKIHVIWIIGNHDPSEKYISNFLGVETYRKMIVKSGKKRIFITHGDQYDEFIKNHPIVTNFADAIYGFMQSIDPSHKLARYLKKKSKKFLKAIGVVKCGVALDAHDSDCTIAIHGHNHCAGMLKIEGVDVWDDGCWVEKPCTFISITEGIVELHNFPKK
jgi:UDP-2,3-diacylglucosamine pyrophosphatase LpxH